MPFDSASHTAMMKPVTIIIYYRQAANTGMHHAQPQVPGSFHHMQDKKFFCLFFFWGGGGGGGGGGFDNAD